MDITLGFNEQRILSVSTRSIVSEEQMIVPGRTMWIAYPEQIAEVDTHKNGTGRGMGVISVTIRLILEKLRAESQ